MHPIILQTDKGPGVMRNSFCKMQKTSWEKLKYGTDWRLRWVVLTWSKGLQHIMQILLLSCSARVYLLKYSAPSCATTAVHGADPGTAGTWELKGRISAANTYWVTIFTHSKCCVYLAANWFFVQYSMSSLGSNTVVLSFYLGHLYTDIVCGTVTYCMCML